MAKIRVIIRMFIREPESTASLAANREGPFDGLFKMEGTLKKFEIFSIGRIVNNHDEIKIEIDEPFREALDGIESFSHANVFFWFHENDTPEGRSVLKVNPCKNPENPLTGVFATHSPLRPNLVGMTRCKITGLDRQKGVVFIDEIDALDGTPLIDIKCYFPPDDAGETIRVPDWKRRRPK